MKVESCGLCAWELDGSNGSLGTSPDPGHEWGGSVVARGDNVAGLKVGDGVTDYRQAFEGFAEYGVLKASHCFIIHRDIPGFVIGEPLKCVVTVVRAAAPEVADNGVVSLSGSIGLFCIQALRGSIPPQPRGGGRR